MSSPAAQQASDIFRSQTAALAESTLQRAQRMQDPVRSQALRSLGEQLAQLARSPSSDAVDELAKRHAAENIVSVAERVQNHAGALDGESDATGQKELAAALFEMGIVLTPNSTWSHWRGLLFMELGRFAEAADAFALAGELSPESGVYETFELQARSASASMRSEEDDSTPKDPESDISQLLGTVDPALAAELRSMLEAGEFGDEVDDEGDDITDDDEEDPESLSPEMQDRVSKAGVHFAYLLVDGHYDLACSLLVPGLQSEYSAARLKKAYEDMTEYVEQPLDTAYAMPPDLLDGDPAVYVAISGDGDNEAVFLTMQEGPDGVLRVSAIEWGRP